MRCLDFQKWLSDGMDRPLSEKKREKLWVHLQECSVCREFERQARRIQDEAKSLASAAVDEGYWEESLARLRRKLAEERGETRPLRRAVPFRRWAWAAVPLVLAVVAAGMWFVLRPTAGPGAEVYLSAEERMGLLTWELESDPALQSVFNRALEADLEAELEGWRSESSGWDPSLLFEGVTDEELTAVLEEWKTEAES